MRTQADREFDWATGRELERKDSEIDRLRHDIERHIQITTEQQAEIERLRAVLLDWRNTPGNQRTAAWWHNWLESLDRALGYGNEPEKARKIVSRDNPPAASVWHDEVMRRDDEQEVKK